VLKKLLHLCAVVLCKESSVACRKWCDVGQLEASYFSLV
jgi:hypothetical protein